MAHGPLDGSDLSVFSPKCNSGADSFSGVAIYSLALWGGADPRGDDRPAAAASVKPPSTEPTFLAFAEWVVGLRLESKPEFQGQVGDFPCRGRVFQGYLSA